MKFAHLADCHIGGWIEPRLRQLTIDAFERAIDICIKENTAFILISGDLFNSALPTIDLLKETARILDKARQQDINVYSIAGSHDFSVSGKTMLDVLEKAGLLHNVVRFEDDKLQLTIDKTGVKITGLVGKKGGLEREYYNNLEKEQLENEHGFKIFMFHSALTEFKPGNLEKMESISVNNLPKNFNYYAGGHVHYILETKYDKGLLVFPGPLFPNNFAELEELKAGGFYIINDKLEARYIQIKLRDVISFNINVNGKKADEVEKEIIDKIKDYKDKIVTLRIEGILKSGKVTDIDFKKINSRLDDAYCVLRNTNKLTTKEFEEIKVKTGNIEDIEDAMVKEHLSKIELNFDEEKMIKELIIHFNKEKEEGEKVFDFENRLNKDVIKILNLGEFWNENK